MLSSDARELARASGLGYCGPTSTLVPSPTADVLAAANVRAISGS